MERARQEFLKEIQIDPNNAGAHLHFGGTCRRDEKWDEAISRFTQAAKIDPNLAEAYLGWGFYLVNLKKYEEAIPLCEPRSALRREIPTFTMPWLLRWSDPDIKKKLHGNSPSIEA